MREKNPSVELFIFNFSLYWIESEDTPIQPCQKVYLLRASKYCEKDAPEVCQKASLHFRGISIPKDIFWASTKKNIVGTAAYTSLKNSISVAR
jgi:hypothetical protein